MSEVYWIAGLDEDLPADNPRQAAAALMQRLLDSLGIPLTRMDEIHWVAAAENGQAKSHPTPLPGKGVPPSSMTWQTQPLLDHFTLQSAARGILSGDTRVSGVFQQTNTRAAAVVIGGPQIVGAFNLNPVARISARLVIHPQKGKLWATIEENLRKHLPEGQEALPVIDVLCSNTNILPELLKTSMAEVRRIEGDTNGAVFRLNALVRNLVETNLHTGLLVDQEQEITLVTMVEKV
jgi:hypothetical protein